MLGNGYILAICLFVSFKKDIKIYQAIIKFIKEKIPEELWEKIKELIIKMISTITNANNANNTKKTELIQFLNSNFTI